MTEPASDEMDRLEIVGGRDFVIEIACGPSYPDREFWAQVVDLDTGKATRISDPDGYIETVAFVESLLGPERRLCIRASPMVLT